MHVTLETSSNKPATKQPLFKPMSMELDDNENNYSPVKQQDKGRTK